MIRTTNEPADHLVPIVHVTPMQHAAGLSAAPAAARLGADTAATEAQQWWAQTTWTADPPVDYGAGHEWADVGPFAVPPGLRDHYTAARIPKNLLAGYFEGGYERSEDRPAEIPTVGGMVDVTLNTLIEYSGQDGWAVFLHDHRSQLAVRAWREERARAAQLAARPTCGVCGRRVNALQPAAMRPYVAACGECIDLLEAEAHDLQRERYGQRSREDGRSYRDAARYAAARFLDRAETKR